MPGRIKNKQTHTKANNIRNEKGALTIEMLEM